MKNIFVLFLFLFIFSTTGYSKIYKDKSLNTTLRNKFYYTSYILLKRNVFNRRLIKESKVNRIIDGIHPSIFIHDYDLDKLSYHKTQLDYAVGLRNFFLNRFDIAKQRLRGVSKKSSMIIETHYILGLINLREKKFKRASENFNKCIRYSRKVKRKKENYVHTFRNRCIQQMARIKFSKKKYKTSLKILNHIRNDDYIWPRLLMDKAWNYYWLKENGRALGTVLTFHAPLLRRFMVPESNYLRSLIYYEMCYFDKSEKIYKDFNRNAWRYRKVIKSASPRKILKLIESKKKPRKDGDRFLYYYLKGFKKDIRYFTYKSAMKKINAEIQKISSLEGLKNSKVLLGPLSYFKKAIHNDFTDFLKNLTNDYYKQIKQMRNAFVKLNLMISLKKRKELGKRARRKDNQSLSELSLNKISNVDNKYIWDFQGGFWADELGDYAVALKSRCN